MATIRNCLKCEVCNTITLVRIQIGWLDSHPIRYNCGNCGILISGIANFDQKNIDYNLSFQNAIRVDETEAKYYIEISGELLTKKVEKCKKEKFPLCPPPFFESFWKMGNENYEIFKKNTVQFNYFIKEKWPKLRRINELYLNDKKEYLVKELKKVFPKCQFSVDNELTILMGMHQLNIYCFYPVINKNFFKKITSFLFNNILNLTNTQKSELEKLLEDFKEKKLFKEYNLIIFKEIENFVENFQFLIPVFGLQFYKEVPEDFKDNCGISTATFEDLKQFYLDCYESIGDLLRIIIAFNNLKHRGDFEICLPIRRDVSTLSNLDEKTKGVKIEYVTGREAFDILISLKLNNKIRNAIAHNRYKYDGINQLIYILKLDGTISDTIYLIDFVEECLYFFWSHINILELIYQCEKINFIKDGNIPINIEYISENNPLSF